MPRAVDSDERRQEITDAAARLIARSGLGAATMRDVAAEAGWTTGTVTHYFADKRELLLHTLQASLANRRRQRPSREAEGPARALRVALAGALPLDDGSRQHWMVTVAFCAQASGDPELAAVQRDAYREFRSEVARLVARCLGVRGAEARAVAERLIAFADGIAMQALFDPASWPPSHQLDELDRTLANWVPAVP
ncbi:MAG: TetR/AcrR family transcriptional regulator [Ilumatobacteraceae bacterium]